MTLVPGLETIKGLAGEPPPEVKINHKDLRSMQVAISAINHTFMALLPFCFKCRAPLIWHIPPYEEGEDKNKLFTCPNCGRVWVRGEGWSDKAKEDTKTNS